MKRIFLILGGIVLACLIIGYILGRVDNGPKDFKPIDTSTLPSRLDE